MVELVPQRAEGGDPGRTALYPQGPVAETKHVDGRGNEKVLQMRLLMPHVA